jgi:pimeloyl-ACP methyl ester carboxylesterase
MRGAVLDVERIGEGPPILFVHGDVVGAAATPSQLPEELVRGVELLKRERPSWEAEIPLDRLASAGFPVLVVSGGHSAAFDAVCDALSAALSAERAVISGRGHTVPSTGAPYNKRLEVFLRPAEAH